jgi:hypothetical protein
MLHKPAASFIRAGLALAVLWAWGLADAPDGEEPLLLRYLRTWAVHPARTGIALFLLDRALAPGRQGPSEPFSRSNGQRRLVMAPPPG